jgi:hypothetical protein
VLSSGIDSLYVSFNGMVEAERLDELETLKARAQGTGDTSVLAIGARKALLQPSGWGRYRYWLRCVDFDVFVGQGKGLSAIYSRLASAFIHEVGAESALAELRSFVKLAFLPELVGALCSRVDIYADFQGWVPRPHDYDRFVTRSRRNTLHIAVHHDGRRFTGFTFGRDAIVGRLYDKTVEIKHSGKAWMRDLWGDQFDPSKPVWRLEFQLRRQVLKECGLSDPDQVVTHRDQLWRYASEWLSLRDVQPGARRVRWPVSNAWKQLAHLEVEDRATPLVRQRIRKHNEAVLLRGLAGYASSLAAISGVSDLDVTMALSRRRLAEYLDRTGRDFRELVHVKLDRTLSR